MHNLFRKGIILLLILPVFLVLLNNAAFRHEHILPNGMRIEHAHPFKACCNNPGTGEGHQHTKSELLLFTLITDSPVFIMLFPLFLTVYRPEEPDLCVFRSQIKICKNKVFYNQLRAPPAPSVL